MQANEAGWAARFYGMALAGEVVTATREHLTDRSIDDLVTAHLAINRAYYGGIDKTLSGFVILDDDGDDYTLLDARDGGKIWWQDHETRELTLRYDSLAEYLAVRASGTDRDARTEPPRSREGRRARAVTTPALCARYQWLVWLLAMPHEQPGRPVLSTDYLVRSGLGRFREQFPTRAALDAAFEAELPELAGDIHLAIYWLLHTTMLADHERRAEVVAAAGASEHALWHAFASRLGSLPLDGDVPIVPDFRARRALATTYGAFELSPDELPAACLRALEISPSTASLAHGLQVVAGLERGAIELAAIRETLGRIRETTTGTALLAAVLDKRADEIASAHADTLARLLATCDDPWWAQLEALWRVHELAYDGAALVEATRRILAHDRFHRRTLQMAMRANQIAGEPIDEIDADLGIADALLGPYTKLAEDPARWRDVVSALPLPHLRRALAWRVLQRVELQRPSAELAAWAIEQVMATSDPARSQLAGDALATLDSDTQVRVIEAITASLDGADHPAIDVLLAFLDRPDGEDTDRVPHFEARRGKEAAVRALAPWVHEPRRFDALVSLVERPASGSIVEVVCSKLFGPFEASTYVLHRLDAAQATRAARALVTTQLRHPDIHARNAAGEQLFRFDHPGAEAYLIDALTDLSVRYAAVRGPGGATLDHGKTENDQLEDVVANLYAAVRNLRTPGARTALVERLFAERRSYARMADALAAVWDADVHGQILRLLAERRDAGAAGCYAFVLRERVRQRAPILELARMLVDWQGDNEITRGFLHYALAIGILEALEAGDDELVRRAHDAASWIAEPPLEPEAFARGKPWRNPLDDDEVQARIARVVSPAVVPPAAAFAPSPADQVPIVAMAEAASDPVTAPPSETTARVAAMPSTPAVEAPPVENVAPATRPTRAANPRRASGAKAASNGKASSSAKPASHGRAASSGKASSGAKAASNGKVASSTRTSSAKSSKARPAKVKPAAKAKPSSKAQPVARTKSAAKTRSAAKAKPAAKAAAKATSRANAAAAPRPKAAKPTRTTSPRSKPERPPATRKAGTRTKRA